MSFSKASGAAKFDLTLAITEFDDGMTATFEYATDLFDSATIRRMLDHFLVLLEGIVAEPEQRLSELPLLSRPNGTTSGRMECYRCPFPRDCCIHTCSRSRQHERRMRSPLKRMKNSSPMRN